MTLSLCSSLPDVAGNAVELCLIRLRFGHDGCHPVWRRCSGHQHQQADCLARRGLAGELCCVTCCSTVVTVNAFPRASAYRDITASWNFSAALLGLVTLTNPISSGPQRSTTRLTLALYVRSKVLCSQPQRTHSVSPTRFVFFAVLLDAKANPAATNSYGQTPLALAYMAGQTSVCHVLEGVQERFSPSTSIQE